MAKLPLLEVTCPACYMPRGAVWLTYVLIKGYCYCIFIADGRYDCLLSLQYIMSNLFAMFEIFKLLSGKFLFSKSNSLASKDKKRMANARSYLFP